ncbi:MAG: EcsC family protein [Methylohalobius sp.]|nr:EcsC family protein [Methylohalobius sp.]
MSPPVTLLSFEDRMQLVEAYRLLEYPSLAARLTSALGKPIESGFKHLPAAWYGAVHDLAQSAIEKALDVALSTMNLAKCKPAKNRLYQLASGACGAMGGFFGLPALMLEIPASTVLMLRAIAAIAREQGERLDQPEARLACLEVFALGGRSPNDDATETGYYGVRLALALAVAEALQFVQTHGLQAGGAPILVRLVTLIAQRFGLTLTERAAALAIPLLGAAGGATINVVFMHHFQSVAKGHFTVRRLERKYGKTVVESEYRRLHVTVQATKRYRRAA